jgi:apolipoprotein N-acyltransferase
LKIFPSKQKLTTAAICAVSGILLGLSFPPYKTWFLAYLGIIILLYLILSSEKLKQVFRRGYFTILVFNIVTVYWVSGWQSNDIFLKLGGIATMLVHPLFFMLPVFLTYFVYKMFGRNTALILFPFLWVGYEYFDNLWQFAFPWIELGNTETYNLNRIQYIEYTGVHGISFLICVISTILYFVIFNIASGKWKKASIKTACSFIIIVMLIIFPNIYSGRILGDNNIYNKYYSFPDSTKIIKSCIVQPNIDPFEKWKKQNSPDSLVDSYITRLNDALRFNPQLIVLHETSTPYYFFEEYYYNNTQKFINFVNGSGKYLLMGIPHLYYYPDSASAPRDSRVTKSGKRNDAFNSAVLLEPNKSGNEYTIHKKVKLVPFSERVPYQEYFPFMQNIIKWGVGISSWQKGTELVMFNMNNPVLKPKAKFATLICYESVFGEYVSEAVKNGAEFLVIITNDGWWGMSPGPVQHKQYAVLRAVENRKWIIRAAQTGISCFIDPLGYETDRIDLNTEGIIVRDIYANSEQTFYSRNGDVIGEIGFYAGIISFLSCLIFYAYIKKVKRNA